MERLQKVLAQAGVASRRKSEELIVSGKVSVNGQVVKELGVKVDPAHDKILVNGEEIKREKLVYIMVNKPQGFITSMEDQFDRPIVLELITDVPQRLHSVGRLDYDTEGLLLLTNDGALTYALTHPSKTVDKVYQVTTKGIITYKAMQKLEKGVQLEDGLTAPAKVEFVKAKGDQSIIKLTIHEGRNRQVRRMMDAVGYPVLRLKRIQMGPLVLGHLKPGGYRHLSAREVTILKKLEKSKGN